MATGITHADLAPSPTGFQLGSKTGVFFMVFSIFLGLFCFILCLISETCRSQVKWESNQSGCSYSGSGEVPLSSATAAFLCLGVAVAVQHIFLLVAISRSTIFGEISWAVPSKTLSWQAGVLFFSTWTSFSVGEILLLIGMSVESGHLNTWAVSRPSCVVIGQGLFVSAGIMGLLSVFLASGLCLTALRIQTQFQEQQDTRQEILEASIMYASPSTSSPRPTSSSGNGNDTSVVTLHQQFLRYVDKISNLV